MYHEGEGIMPNVVEAHKWFNLSAKNKFNGSVRQRDKIEKNMTASQIELARRLAKEWIESFFEYSSTGK